MNPRVSEYLKSCETQKEAENRRYREKVLRLAGLIDTIEVECSEDEYYEAPQSNCAWSEKREDGWHFVIQKQVPIEVTDEEFAAIEKTIRQQDLQNTAETEERSGAASFFMILAWFIWIGGLIAAVVMAFQKVPHTSTDYFSRAITTYTTEFSVTVFLIVFAACIVSGAVCRAASELFRQLQTSVNLLRRKG